MATRRRNPGTVNSRQCLTAALMVALTPTAAAQVQFGIEPVPGARVEPPAALLDTWGTAPQCATGGPPYPYRVEREWIEQGGIYCYVTWRASYPGESGFESHALAQCGEDTLREYRIFLLLEGERLRIRWSDSYTTPPLSRCR